MITMEEEIKDVQVISEGGFKARDIGLRTQKKLLSKMSGMSVSRMFIDESTSSLLDHLYAIAKKYSNDKKESEKLIKNIIKTVIKFAILFRNNLFDDDQKDRILVLKGKLKTLAMNIMTFYEMDYTYDRVFLSHCIGECHDGVLSIAQIHLSPNSISRINRVFGFFGNDQFLDQVFGIEGEYRGLLKKVVDDLNCAIDSKVFG